MEVLSPGLSPLVALPGTDPGSTPFENNRVPEIVEGPPTAVPSTAIKMVRQSCGAILSVPFESQIDEPLLPVIDQPGGKVCPVAATRAISDGILIWGLNL